MDNKSLLASLLFWLDVTDFNAAEKRSGDRYLRLVNAWAIFNKYIANGKYKISFFIDLFICLFCFVLLLFFFAGASKELIFVSE